jgi:hypothetical protein
MKKLLITLVAMIAFWGQAQICTIDYSQTQTGIYPDTLPTGYVGQPYDTDITFVMPLDTLGYDFTNFYIMSVSLPVGLSWECNSFANNCNYNPQVSQHGCVNISGTPLLAGVYSVYVTVLADLTVISGYPFSFEIFLEILPNNVSTSNNGFSMTGAAGCSPITVDFTNNNPGLLAYEWDFGNGNISTLENPVPQVYTTPGDYVVEYTAWNNQDTIDVYTLSNVAVTSMSNYGGGFPSYDNADAYFILKENGATIYQSPIIGDQNPPVNWNTSILLNPSNTYVIEVYEADDSFGEVILGADDYMGNHTLNITGCNGCAAGTSTINYTINHQVIYPIPTIVSIDTIHVYGYPAVPIIDYTTANHTLSTPDMGYMYQWYFNDSPINGATDTSWVVTQSGVYHVIAINSTGCVSFSDTMTAIYCDPSIEPVVYVAGQNLLVATGIPLGYEIQWLLNGFAITGQTNDSINTLMSGSYSVEITDTFGCVHTSAPFSVSLNVAEIDVMNWNVYPNPANEYVTIEINSNILPEMIQLVDLTGRTVKEWENVKDPTIKLDISEIPDGYFIVRIMKGTQFWTQKLLIN